MIDWSAIDTLSNVVRLVRDILGTKNHKNNTPTIPEKKSESFSPKIKESYQVGLGHRHKAVRENILELNPREMADFYGYEKVSLLEKCEAGEDEFPTISMQKLVQTFFIRPKYLQEGEKPIFQNFSIISTVDDCKRFLEKEFDPYFLCDPLFENTGFGYLVFYKIDDGYHRMICSNTVGGFFSSGGGRQNVENLIDSMLALDMSPSKVHCLSMKSNTWKQLEKRNWYNKGMLGFIGMANYEAHDIFDEWFEEAKETDRKNKEYVAKFEKQ